MDFEVYVSGMQMLLLGHSSAYSRIDKGRVCTGPFCSFINLLLGVPQCSWAFAGGIQRGEVVTLYALEQPKLGRRVSVGLTRN